MECTLEYSNKIEAGMITIVTDQHGADRDWVNEILYAMSVEKTIRYELVCKHRHW